ncbi:cilia- and flagella-associated protein 44 [Fundulus heteroclitus]|uniref:cilia- and flagella-associated protein 44 n=1 Tax=Fundulus heteroclitus TaxID=8078 RepID=UPI00165B0573|nr:cilia- and flagella-associated protein 44 [Fundulus heteroclitus]XP_021173608.2 cilia- and flagella-associated protein 44 [Fundulus heteroclitus]
MSDNDTSSVGEQAENTSTFTPEDNEECDAEPSEIRQEPGGRSKELPADMYYNYEELHSRPTVTPDSEIPENLLHLSHSFGYDSSRRSNLKLLDETTLMFIAGNLLVLLDVPTKQQRYLRSCSGEGIGAIAVHPAKEFFSVAEKGNHPSIIIYEYPSLRPYRVLRGGTECEYSFVDFNLDGSLLASVGGAPDYMLTLWNWRQEEVKLSCKAISQEVYRVSFSPYNPGLLTSSGSGHIKFWKMATTFTGLKLQGVMGHFGKTAATDIEGFVELPDGKVVSGTEWGNLLLWEGNTIRVEICRKERRRCHIGMVQPFTLEDGQLMTFGADGAIRAWDFERINTSSSSSSMFEMEPINELVVGHNVWLSSVVRSSLPDSFIWFAQDSNGAVWKLDLSFTNTAAEPERLFSFHSGAIQGLDVSKKSHLMATTTLDRSVRVFDFVAKRELLATRFNQGGTTLSWAPPLVNQSGGLLVTGFEDGVVRLLELYNPRRPQGATETDAELRLRQAFKPHNAPVTTVAYDRSGEILATGSSDCTVFFFTVGDKYQPIGFIHVPGPVQALEWSPHSHTENRLLILCRSGHVVEVHSADLAAQESTKTYKLHNLPRRSFRFRSIKSRIKREEEITRRQAAKEKKRKEREERLKELGEENAVALEKEEEEKEEDEPELPPICIPNPPSPLCCGFYSQPGQFWLSMGGFDAGFLYHCKLSENQEEDPLQRQDEPFAFRHIHEADHDPICSVTFSSGRQLLLCGMQSGSIRVYPLQPGDHSLTSLQAYWALSVHDNQYGHLRHVRCSLDDLFVLTAGGDSNIFSFCLLPPEEVQKTLETKAKIPSPRAGLEIEALALDIEDPAAYSIETAKQKTEKDNLRREAELKEAEMQRQLLELQRRFKQVLSDNQSLPEHIRLKPEELLLDRRFYEQAEKQKARKVMEVRKQMAWEQERSSIALRKLQEWSEGTQQTDVITVVALRSNHRVSTYRLPALPPPLTLDKPHITTNPNADGGAAQERRKPRAEPPKDSHQTQAGAVLQPTVVPKARIKLGDRQEEKLRKAAEKAEQARAKIERRKQEWAQIYAEKPEENYVDPQDVQAIREAKENLRDFIRGKQPRVDVEQKKKELVALEEKIHEKQAEMNRWIVALRDHKVRLLSWMAAQAQRLQEVQQGLAVHLRQPPPTLTTILPEEMPEKKLQVSQATLQRYWTLREQRMKCVDQEDAVSLLEQLEKEMELEEDRVRGEEKCPTVSAVSRDAQETPVELSELEEELQMEEEIRLLYEQNCLLQQMENSVCQFDAELLQLHRHKLHLDSQLKLADLRLLTLLQEMLILKQFEKREGALEEKRNGCLQEEKSITSKLEECNELLEQKRSDIAKLQEREKTVTDDFKASLGENNPFQEFLTKVFKKKIKRVKKKEEGSEGEEKDSDEDSDEESDSDDDYDSDLEEGNAAFDDSVCPRGCEPELFENTLQLRERRLDVEELLVEEKRILEALKKESELLVKKIKVVQGSRRAVEDDLELINKEKQQKMNELDVVVPLRLHQIAFLTNGSIPSDLSEAMVLDRAELQGLQQRIQQLEAEKVEQKELHRQAHQHRNRLIREGKDMNARIQELELQCNELLMTKFGRLVDLEALQMLTGSRRLEELKQEKLLTEAAQAKEIKLWDVKIEESLEALTEAMKTNNKHLHNLSTLYEQRKELEQKLNARQKKMGRRQFRDHRRLQDQDAIRRLEELVQKQCQQAEALWKDIDLLSSKGGHVLPHNCAPLAPIAPLPSPTSDMSTEKQGAAIAPELHHN